MFALLWKDNPLTAVLPPMAKLSQLPPQSDLSPIGIPTPESNLLQLFLPRTMMIPP
jgi:hypothetical protein